MSDIKSGITLIRGDGSFPPPKTRTIYPDKVLLWKYYLEVFIVWLIVLMGLAILTMFFIGISARKVNPAFFATPEFQFFIIIVFIVLTLIFGPLVLLSLFFYVRSMEFIVHGDEILVKKGLFNKTIKYCPFRTITNISTSVGLLDRIFEIGCVKIQTAGSSGTKGGRPEEILEGLRVYPEIREYIISQMRGVSSPPKEMYQQAILKELLLVKQGFRKYQQNKKR